MDRNLVYPGSIPLDSDILNLNRNTMIAIGCLAKAVLGTNPVVDGLACTPQTPASLSVVIGPGSITQLVSVDASAYGSLSADSDPLLKMGINLEPVTLALTPPNSSGQSIDYLIEATFLETDSAPLTLPYYNAANPAQPYSGPNNSGAAQNTQRTQRVGLLAKPGTQANTGQQMPPAVDNNCVGLYVVTVSYGQTAITAANITALPTAPFLNWKLPNLAPGFASGVQVFSSNGTFIVPAGVTQVQVELWGGGSGSFASIGSTASGGGSGGGYARKRIAGLTPGQSIPVTVGPGGVGGTTAGTPASAGGTSSFGSYVSATGGSLNGSAAVATPQNGAIPGGVGVGGDINLTGSSGQASFMSAGGLGGGAPLGGMQTNGTTGVPGVWPGGGASGAGTGSNGATPYNGGPGAAGLVVVRW